MRGTNLNVVQRPQIGATVDGKDSHLLVGKLFYKCFCFDKHTDTDEYNLLVHVQIHLFYLRLSLWNFRCVKLQLMVPE